MPPLDTSGHEPRPGPAETMLDFEGISFDINGVDSLYETVRTGAVNSDSLTSNNAIFDQDKGSSDNSGPTNHDFDDLISILENRVLETNIGLLEASGFNPFESDTNAADHLTVVADLKVERGERDKLTSTCSIVRYKKEGEPTRVYVARADTFILGDSRHIRTLHEIPPGVVMSVSSEENNFSGPMQNTQMFPPENSKGEKTQHDSLIKMIGGTRFHVSYSDNGTVSILPGENYEHDNKLANDRALVVTQHQSKFEPSLLSQDQLSELLHPLEQEVEDTRTRVFGHFLNKLSGKFSKPSVTGDTEIDTYDNKPPHDTVQ